MNGSGARVRLSMTRRASASSFLAFLFTIVLSPMAHGEERATDPQAAGKFYDEGAMFMLPAVESRPLWQARVPIKVATYLTDLRVLSRDRLLVSTGGEPPVLVDTSGRRPLWRLDSALKERAGGSFGYTHYRVAASDGSSVIICSYRGPTWKQKTKLTSVRIEDGVVNWTVEVDGNRSSGFIPAYDAGVLVAVQWEGGKFTLYGYALADGKLLWSESFKAANGWNRAVPVFVHERGLIVAHEELWRLDALTGRAVWKVPGVVLDAFSPMPVLDGREFVVVDRNKVLRTLDPASGAVLTEAALPQEDVFSSIVPIGRRIYLPGARKAPTSDAGLINHLTALDRIGRKVLWTYASGEPVVSNLIDEDGHVYLSTWSTVHAVDRESGKARYSVQASSSGKFYPVKVRKYGGSVVHVGEFRVTAVNASTGAKEYSRGFDQMSPWANTDAVEDAIEHYRAFIRAYYKSSVDEGGPSAFSGLAGVNFERARLMQERANALQSEAMSLRWSGASTSDLSRARRLQMQSQIESSFIKAEMSIGMAMSTLDNLARGMTQVTSFDRQKMLTAMDIRRKLATLHLRQDLGDYAFRPMSDGDYVGVTVVHLPTGRIASKRLLRKGRGLGYLGYISPEISSLNVPSEHMFGLLNAVDIDNGVIYGLQMRMYPDADSRPVRGGEKWHGLYLVAERLPLSK